ncbi:MAG: hypothetical protein EOO75_00775 [Myxococcales bacterium]|nr:MAG: hypothetical protein EOO75_00775 [Myxococcales bacterium]
MTTGLRADTAQLRREQATTRATPRRRYSAVARLLFGALDAVFGRRGSLAKFKALEVVARSAYQAWESAAYLVVTRTRGAPQVARRTFAFVRAARAQQDAESWHLFLLAELVERRGEPESLVRHRLLPRALAWAYYHLTLVLLAHDPALSYRLNADFEDHAEHEYMDFVAAHPELEGEPFVSDFAAEYGSFASVADLIRSFAVDERRHKDESLGHVMEAALDGGSGRPG